MKVCEMNWKFSLKNLEKKNERSHNWWLTTSAHSKRFSFRKSKDGGHYVLKLINENKYSWDFSCFHFPPAALFLTYGEFSNTVCAGTAVLSTRVNWVSVYVSYFIFSNWNINIFWILFQLFLTEMIEKKKKVFFYVRCCEENL